MSANLQRFLLLLLLAVGTASRASGQAADHASTVPASAIDARTRAELFAAREAVWRAYFAGDTALLRRLLPERMVAIDGGGKGWSGRDEVLAGAQAFARSGGRLVRLAFSGDELLLAGEVAVIYSQYTAETEVGGARSTMAGRATEVFVRRKGTWLNPSWHLDSTP